jgi:hypothetical protein
MHVSPDLLIDELLLTLLDISRGNLSLSSFYSAALVEGKNRHRNWGRHYVIWIPHSFYKMYIRNYKSLLLLNSAVNLYYSAHTWVLVVTFMIPDYRLKDITQGLLFSANPASEPKPGFGGEPWF